MKELITITMVLCSLVMIQSCSKEEGPIGPKGDKGDTGATGQNGISGAVAFTFSNKALPIEETISVTQGFVDSTVCLVYYEDASNPLFTYQSPGLGLASVYQTRYFLSRDGANPSFYMYLLSPTGDTYNTATTFQRVKVVFIPITLYGKNEPVDYNDYKATMKYYGLPE